MSDQERDSIQAQTYRDLKTTKASIATLQKTLADHLAVMREATSLLDMLVKNPASKSQGAPLSEHLAGLMDALEMPKHGARVRELGEAVRKSEDLQSYIDKF